MLKHKKYTFVVKCGTLKRGPPLLWHTCIRCPAHGHSFMRLSYMPCTPHMAAVLTGYGKALVGTGWAISLLLWFLVGKGIHWSESPDHCKLANEWVWQRSWTNSQNVNSQNVNFRNVNFPHCQLLKCYLLKFHIFGKMHKMHRKCKLFHNLSDCSTNRKFWSICMSRRLAQ